MQEIHEEVYDLLERDLEERGLLPKTPFTVSQRQIKDKMVHIRRTLLEWQDVVQFQVVDLSSYEGSEYESALVLILQPRSRQKKLRASASINSVVVGKKKSGELNIQCGNINAGFFNRTFSKIKGDKTLSPQNILAIIADDKSEVWKNKKQINDLDELRAEIDEGRTVASRFFAQEQRRFLKRIDFQKKQVKFIALLITQTMNQVIERRIVSSLADFEKRHVQQADVNWLADRTGNTEFSLLTLYNHLQTSSDETAKDYRKGAMQALREHRPSGYFLYATSVWKAIDSGDALFKAIGRFVGAKEGTVKRMYRESDWLDGEQDIKKYAPYLDAIDPQYWPHSPEQSHSFRRVVDLAECYGETFDRDSAQTVKVWVRNNKSLKTWSGEFSWSDMVKSILKPHIMDILKTKYGAMGDIPDVVIQEPGDAIIKDALGKYKRDAGDIGDMKSDIRKRLIQPMCLVAMEKQDVKVSDADVLSSVIDSISQQLYAGMSPSDQIKASAYWHSPNVDIQRRFNSAVLNAGSGYKEWEPLFEGEYWEAKNGVRFYPLVSAEALRGEGNAMSHCVGSYASSCMTYNYHIMSLVDQDGQRLSTLTVQDYFEGDKRQIRKSQNRSFKNALPSKKAEEATEKFIEIVNEGKKIKPDWQAIDSVRAEYKTNQIANQAGYDIRDPEQCQAVLDVYIPCVSKKVIRECGGQFDQLVNILGVDQVVSDFIERFDFSQGGLVRTSNQTQIFVNDNPGQQLRPRMA